MPVPMAKNSHRIHAFACAKTPFAIGDGAHIVENRDRQTGQSEDGFRQRNMRPGAGQVGQEERLAFIEVQHARDTDPDSADILFFLTRQHG